MNRVKSIAAFLLIVLFALTGCAPGQNPPVAEKGRLDLSGWDIQTRGALSLDGEWAFYWGRLLTPSDFVSGRSPEKTGYMHLPGLWRGRLNGTDLSAHGCATYRLLVDVEPDERSMAMLVRNPLSVCRVWVNGTIVAESGRLGASRETEQPRRHMMGPRFSTAGEHLEIILQVSNHTNMEGGINVPICLGSVHAIQLMANRKLIMVAVLGGALFVMAFYHLALFFVRRSEPANLYFGLYCLMWSVSSVFGETGVCLMATLIPDLPWRTAIDFALLPHGVAVPLMVMFYHALFPRSRSIIIERFYQVLGAAFIIYIVMTPPNAFGILPFAYYLVSLGAFAYLFVRFAADLIRREEGTLFLIPGYLILALSGIHDKLCDLHVIHTISTVPYGSFVFVLFYSLLIFIRFSRTVATVEKLSHELDEKNMFLSRLDRLEEKADTPLEENLKLKEASAFCEKREQGRQLTPQRLEGETLHMLVLRNPSQADGPEEVFLNAVKLVDSLDRTRQRFQFLDDSLCGTIGRVERLSRTIGRGRAGDNPPGQGNSGGIDKKRELAVRVMNLSLDYWVTSTRTAKIELADKSCLWNVYIEKDGFARTQTLDKYLTSETLPKKPRWRQVINTADFVLSTCNGQSPLRGQLEESLAKLRVAL